MFTNSQIKGLKPKDKMYDLREGRGFGVRVLPSGTKSWFFIYVFEGQKKRLSIGIYPDVGLAEAREKADEARSMLRNGIDPGAARDGRKNALSVNDLIEEYLQKWAMPRKKSWKEDRRILYKDVSSSFGKKKVQDVVRRDIIELLEEIVDRDASVMANRTLAVVRKMFGFAVQKDIIQASPCLYVAEPSIENEKDRCLTEDEIRNFWFGIDSTGISESIRRGLKLVLATGQRPGECVSVDWSEIDGRWWTIPAKKAKNGLSNTIYLNDIAMELLGAPKKAGPAFPSSSPVKKDLSAREDSMAKALRRKFKAKEMGIASEEDGLLLKCDPFTPHDLRRTCATFMAGVGVSRFVIGKVLNHLESGVTRIYDRHSYHPKIEKALKIWGIRLQHILAEKKSVEF